MTLGGRSSSGEVRPLHADDARFGLVDHGCTIHSRRSRVRDHTLARTLLGPPVAFVLTGTRVDQRGIQLDILATDAARPPNGRGRT